MIYFFSIIFCLILAFFAEKKDNKTFVFIIALYLTLLSGLRGYTVGLDTSAYIDYWYDYMNIGTLFIEPGLIFIIDILQRFTSNPTWMLLVTSIIIYPLIIFRLWDFRNIASYPIMVSLFVILNFVPSINIMRQYISVAIIFFFSRYLFNKRYIIFLFGVVLGTIFHYSALTGLLFLVIEYFGGREKNKKQKIFVFLFFSVLIFYSSSLITLLNKYSGYFIEMKSNIGMLTFLKIICVVMFYLLLSKRQIKIKNKYFDINLIKIIIFITVFGLLLQSLGYFYPFMDRIGLNFYIFEVIVWGLFIKNSDLRGKLLCMLCMLLLDLTPFIISLYSNGSGETPFVFFWE